MEAVLCYVQMYPLRGKMQRAHDSTLDNIVHKVDG